MKKFMSVAAIAVIIGLSVLTVSAFSMKGAAERKMKVQQADYVQFAGTTLGTCQDQADKILGFWDTEGKVEGVPFEVLVTEAMTLASSWVVHCQDLVPDKAPAIEKMFTDNAATLKAEIDAYKGKK